VASGNRPAVAEPIAAVAAAGFRLRTDYRHSSIIIVIFVVMMMVPVAVTIVTILVDYDRRPVVPRRRIVVSGYILRWSVIPGRRRDVNRRRCNNHSRQPDPDIDRPVGGVRAGCKRRGGNTESDYSTEGI
jgi:hypothetical protein